MTASDMKEVMNHLGLSLMLADSLDRNTGTHSRT